MATASQISLAVSPRQCLVCLGSQSPCCPPSSSTKSSILTFGMILKEENVSVLPVQLIPCSLDSHCPDGLYYSRGNLPVSLFPLPVFYGLPSVQEHQWEAVKPPSHEQSSPPSLRGNGPPCCTDSLLYKCIFDPKV